MIIIRLFFLLLFLLVASCASQSEKKSSDSGFAVSEFAESDPSDKKQHIVPTNAEKKNPLIFKKQKQPSRIIKNSPNKHHRSSFPTPHFLPINQWYEIIVETKQPIGAYTIELSFEEKESQILAVKGGHSSYFTSPPWSNQQDPPQNSLQLSSFHGDSDGPLGKVSVCFFEVRKSGESAITGKILNLIAPDQTPIKNAKLKIKLRKKFSEEEHIQWLVSEKTDRSLFPTEIFLITTQPIGGYVINLEYNPAVIHIHEITGGSSPYFSTPPFSSSKTYASGNTKISGFHGAMLGPKGKTSICWVKFKRVKPGRSSLKTTEIDVTNTTGEKIPSSAELSKNEILVPAK